MARKATLSISSKNYSSWSLRGWLLARFVGLDFDEIMAVARVVEALQAQTPMWEPGTAHGYHALTYGWLAGELVRRVSGQSLGAFFAENVAKPTGAKFWIDVMSSPVSSSVLSFFCMSGLRASPRILRLPRARGPNSIRP